MIGLGLTLMGGAMAQNERGVAEAVYYPAQAAYCTRTAGLQTYAYVENIRREWSDETFWFHAVTLCASVPRWVPLGVSINMIFRDGNNLGSGYYVQHNGESPYRLLHIYYRYPNAYYYSVDSSTQSFEVLYTVRNDKCRFKVYTLDQTYSVTQSDAGDESTTRNVSVFNAVRTFWGLSYQSVKGNVRVLYTPMADGQGRSAIWSVFSQTLVEL